MSGSSGLTANYDPICLVCCEIDRLIASLTKKSLQEAEVEIKFVSYLSTRYRSSANFFSFQLIAQWGCDAERYLLRSLFSAIDFSVDFRNQPKDIIQAQLLNRLFKLFSPRTRFLSNFCVAFDSPLKDRSALFGQQRVILIFSFFMARFVSKECNIVSMIFNDNLMQGYFCLH